MSETLKQSLTPKQVVEELDKFVIGQADAKIAIAIALRNRWRRKQVMLSDPKMADEIMPKNILMIGPTGVGKTEIARRVSRLADAPFTKVEATKFTEIGYVGRDVETIIRDLVETAIKREREVAIEQMKEEALNAAEERVLDVLLPRPPASKDSSGDDNVLLHDDSSARQVFRKKLREKELDDREIEIELSVAPVGVEIMAPPGMEDMTSQLQSMFQNLNADRLRSRKLKIKDAMRMLQEEEATKLLNEEDIKTRALDNVEQNGIVFIDEIDKICPRSEQMSGADISRGGVQRDLLPLIEGCTVSTKYGVVKTDHILFIASGAFHLAKPSDLIPELQGRLPIRVELKALTASDFKRILTEPSASLLKQYEALMLTEGVTLEITDDAVEQIADIAWQVNERTENIGARRLQTVMERLLNDISFDASERSGERCVVDGAYVSRQLKALAKDDDLSRYIL